MSGFTNITGIAPPTVAEITRAISSGRDIVVIGGAGSATAAAIASAVVSHVTNSPRHPQPFEARALLVTPSRARAVLLEEMIRRAGGSVMTATLLDGEGSRKHAARLLAGTDVAIGMPASVREMRKNWRLVLRQTEIVVVDDADCMADHDVVDEIRIIALAVGARCQRVIFAETTPGSAAELAIRRRANPVQIGAAR